MTKQYFHFYPPWVPLVSLPWCRESNSQSALTVLAPDITRVIGYIEWLLMWELNVNIHVHNLPQTNSERRNSLFLCPQSVELKQWTHNPLVFVEGKVDKLFITAGDHEGLLHCDFWLYIHHCFCAVAESFLLQNWMLHYRIAVSQNGFEAEFIICEYTQFSLDYLWRSEHIKPFSLKPVHQTEEPPHSPFFLFWNLGIKQCAAKNPLLLPVDWQMTQCIYLVYSVLAILVDFLFICNMNGKIKFTAVRSSGLLLIAINPLAWVCLYISQFVFWTRKAGVCSGKTQQRE